MAPSVLNPTFDDDNPFPPIPPINNDDIRTRVFTHRSFYARPNHVFEDRPDDPSPDNEKFEHLGDTVLGLVVTNLLLDMYPNLRVGPSTKIRALIVGNATLAAISRRYALPARLRLHPAQAITLKASLGIQGTYTLMYSLYASHMPCSADIFESYVGGLYLDQGLDAVDNWLRVLLKPYSTEAYSLVRIQHGLPPLPPPSSPPLAPSTSVSSASSGSFDANTTPSTPMLQRSGRGITASLSPCWHSHRHPHASGTPTTVGHLALFNQQLQKERREVEWAYDECIAKGTATTPIWAVRVEVDGEVFGRGKGSTKKAARNEAAKEGLIRLGIEV